MKTVHCKVLCEIFRPDQCFSNAFLSSTIAGCLGAKPDASMWLGYRSQIDPFFPITDHYIRGFSILGSRSLPSSFQQLYNNTPNEFQIGSVSNLLFMALACEQLPQSFISFGFTFEYLASSSISIVQFAPKSERLEVNERPLFVFLCGSSPSDRSFLVANHAKYLFPLGLSLVSLVMLTFVLELQNK